MKENQAVTTTVKMYFERKIQSVKEFYQIGNEILMSLLIVKDTNETETFLKIVK